MVPNSRRAELIRKTHPYSSDNHPFVYISYHCDSLTERSNVEPMFRGLFFARKILCLACLLAFSLPMFGSRVQAVEVVIRVSGGSLAETVAAARADTEAGKDVTVLVPPGTYRDSVEIAWWKESKGSLTLQAEVPGTAVITGTDIWPDWKKTGELYVHDWPFEWGFQAWPNGWPSRFKRPIIRRREMLFVDGEMFRQVLNKNRLKNGTFFVDEEKGAVYLKPQDGSDLAPDSVEVSVRHHLLTIRGMSNVTVRGLVFRGASDGLSDKGAVRILDSKRITLEDNRFEWNNWTGLFVAATEEISTARNVMNYNGGIGWSGWKIRNLQSDGDETSYNNWRGAWGDFIGWAVAGTKHLRIHNAVYRRHKAFGNETRGFWLDFDIENVVIESPSWSQNLTDGAFLEGMRGPVTLTGGEILGNGINGLLMSGSRNLTISDTTIMNNGQFQINVSGDKDRAVDNWETGVITVLNNEDWIMKNNRFKAFGDQRLVDVLRHQRKRWTSTLRSQDNTCETTRKTRFDSFVC